MSRAIWKGSISFGLVYVPVSLYSGEQREEIHFKQIDKRDFSPIGYQRVNKSTGQEVAWDDIVKGYEYEKGEFVVVSDEELQQANPEATQSVEIVDFVAADAIPLMFFDKPYYLEPQKRAEKGYVLLRETLKRTGKVGIARVVLRTRQYLAALVPVEDALVLELIRYDYELRKPQEFTLPSGDIAQYGVSDKEIEMAERLVEGMSADWQPEKYHDAYREDVLHLIDEKVRAGRTHVLEPAAPPKVTRPRAEVVDLMALLKQSVEQQAQSRGKGPEEPRKRPRKQA